MSWKCPECSSDNPDSILRCYCGHEFGQNNLVTKRAPLRDWQEIEKTKKLLKIIAACALVIFLIIVSFMKHKENVAFSRLPQEEQDKILVEKALHKADHEKSLDEIMAEIRERDRHKSVYEQNKDLVRELDRIEKAAILDRQEEERRAVDKYRQYK